MKFVQPNLEESYDSYLTHPVSAKGDQGLKTKLRRYEAKKVSYLLNLKLSTIGMVSGTYLHFSYCLTETRCIRHC